MEISFRPLGKVMEIVATARLEITYAFDDLVFAEHSVFIIRFDKENEKYLYLYFNIECERDTVTKLKQTLLDASVSHGFSLFDSGVFRLHPKTGQEEIDIEFDVLQ